MKERLHSNGAVKCWMCHAGWVKRGAGLKGSADRPPKEVTIMSDFINARFLRALMRATV
jgi:hypothetical protein